MLPFETFVCCGGIVFVNVPLVGLLEMYFSLGVAAALTLVGVLLWRFRRFASVTLLLIAVAGGIALNVAVSRSETEAGVKGQVHTTFALMKIHAALALEKKKGGGGGGGCGKKWHVEV